MFRGAAIYGAIVLLPMYLLVPSDAHLPAFLGFVGCALVFQWVFWIVGGDPQRYRALMLPAVAEKWVFAAPVLALFALGRVDTVTASFAAGDILLSVGFIQAFRLTAVT
jgi:hypothetical protein